MGSVDEYLAGLPAGPDRAELERIHALVPAVVPGCEQGVSYNLACYLYRGVPVGAAVVTKKHLSWYPYSGQVIRKIAAFDARSQSKGALHFSPSTPLGDDELRELLIVRMREIDEKLDSPKRR